MELTDRAWNVVQAAGDEAERLGDETIGTDHILLSMLRDGEGAAAYVLHELGVSYDIVYQRLFAST